MTVIAALGDSLTGGSPGYHPDPEIRQKFFLGDDERSSFEYWAELANDAIEVRNCGVPGERTAPMALRLHSCAEGADRIMILGGTNDIDDGLPPTMAARNLRQMVIDAKELGLDVAIATIPPLGGRHPMFAAPVTELNAHIAAIAAEQGVKLLPVYEALENPSAPNEFRPDLEVPDHIHPSVKGYRVIGELVARELGESAEP